MPVINKNDKEFKEWMNRKWGENGEKMGRKWGENGEIMNSQKKHGMNNIKDGINKENYKGKLGKEERKKEMPVINKKLSKKILKKILKEIKDLFKDYPITFPRYIDISVPIENPKQKKIPPKE